MGCPEGWHVMKKMKPRQVNMDDSDKEGNPFQAGDWVRLSCDFTRTHPSFVSGAILQIKSVAGPLVKIKTATGPKMEFHWDWFEPSSRMANLDERAQDLVNEYLNPGNPDLTP